MVLKAILDEFEENTSGVGQRLGEFPAVRTKLHKLVRALVAAV